MMEDTGKSESVEEQFINFIKERLEKHGTLNLQNLTGHLSALPAHVRGSFGSSKTALKKFVKDHPEHFTLDKKENLAKASPGPLSAAAIAPKSVSSSPPLPKTIPPPQPTVQVQPIPKEPKEVPAVPKNDQCKEKALPSELLEVKGKVYRLFEFYGFISVSSPVFTSIYFDVQSFEFGRYKTLTEAKVKLGELMILNAQQGPENCEAQYRAYEVRRSDTAVEQNGEKSVPNEEIEGKGWVHNIFTTYGFISQSSVMKDNIFFHLKIFSADSKSLPEVLKIGDRVCFRAKPSEQKDSPVKWQATAVWMDKPQSVESSVNAKGDIYISSGESSLDLESEHENEDDDVYDGEGEYKSEEFESEDTTQPSKQDERSTNDERVGLLTPKSSHMAMIVFGDEYKERAMAIPQVVYVNNTQVKDFMWEIDDAQKVTFQAFQDSGWKTLLAWIGPKPSVTPMDVAALTALYKKTLSSVPSEIGSPQPVHQAKSYSRTSSDWGSIMDEEASIPPVIERKRSPGRSWQPKNPPNIFKKQASLTSSSAPDTPKKTPSPSSIEINPHHHQMAPTINREVLESPLVTMPMLVGNHVQHPSASMVAHMTPTMPPNFSHMRPMGSHNIESTTFYHPAVFTGLNMAPDSQHAFALETRIKELTQHVQLLEALIKKENVPLDVKSTQTSVSVEEVVKKATVNRATQTMSTGRVMYDELFHD